MPRPDPARPALLGRLPVARTSLLVAGLMTTALALVVLNALGPAPAPAAARSSPAGVTALAAGTDPPTPLGLLHPQAVVPPSTTTTSTTTTPPHAAPAVPRPPVTERPPPAPTGTTPSPPTGAPALRGILPPANPAANIAPSPAFSGLCAQDGFASGPCVAAATQATTAARAGEGLGAMALPADFAALPPEAQLFVLADVERVDRGLPPIVGMVQAFNDDAQAAAATNADPTPASAPPGSAVLSWASNWAETAGPLGSNYIWMYEDGPGSGNLACTGGNAGACWGHRDNILGFDAAQVSSSGGVLVMGAAQATVAGDSPWSSDAELIALVTGNPAYTYTWAQAEAAGAR